LVIRARVQKTEFLSHLTLARPFSAFGGITLAAGPAQVLVVIQEVREKVTRAEVVYLARFAAAEEELVPQAVGTPKFKVPAQEWPVRLILVLRGDAR